MTTTADIITRMLTDREKATEGAQALADHYKAVADKQRTQIDKLAHANADLYGRIERLRLDLDAEHSLAVEHIERWEMVARVYTREMEKRMRLEDALEAAQLQLTAYRRQYGALFENARAVVESAARELNYSSDVLLVSTAALRELARCVHEPAQSEETRLGI